MDDLSRKGLKERFPIFDDVPEDWIAMYEHEAGFIATEWAIKAHADIARQHGAELHENV